MPLLVRKKMDAIKTVLEIFVLTFIFSIGDNAAVVGSKDFIPAASSHVAALGVRDCTLSVAGHEYIGHTSVTATGKTCQAWAVQTPHGHGFNKDYMFPDGSATGASNYCRNPENGFIGLWCYTEDPDVRWEKCDVPTCACKLEPEARTYRGLMRSTISGKMCQHWSEQSPHAHKFTDDSDFADGSVQAADNFCRNPDVEFTTGAWCYTMNNNTRWEICDVPLCSPRSTPPETTTSQPTTEPTLAPALTKGVRDCTLSVAGHEYIGHTSVTVSGKNCQAWAVQTPHQHQFNEDYMFPDGSATGASNNCRNPENGFIGLWCYTEDSKVRWEKCDVPTCACKLETEARTYRGLMRSTISGKMCQHWTAQSPHEHKFTDDSDFADGSVQAADNFCRNPDLEFTTGAWCYTMNNNTRWEICDVPLCNPQT